MSDYQGNSRARNNVFDELMVCLIKAEITHTKTDISKLQFQFA